MSETRDETFTRAVLREVLAERGRQHAERGEQNLSDGTAGVTPAALLRAELIQVAAVAVAWVEAIDRRATCHDES